MNYQWTAPLIERGQRVRFRDHRGTLREGECYGVNTWYDRDGVARHSYHIGPDGWSRALWLGGDNLIMPYNYCSAAKNDIAPPSNPPPKPHNNAE